MTQVQSTALPDLPLASPLKALSPRGAAVVIVALSAVIVAFLFWLIYFRPTGAYTSGLVRHLPAVNASLNFVSTCLLVAGYVAVRRRRYALHLRLMFAALASSGLFFVSYVVYHSFHGNTKFLATGPIRPIYLFILASHVILSAVSLPMILSSFYLSLAGKLRGHRVLSRWTLPIWLYVSVTGVLIFVFLKVFNP